MVFGVWWYWKWCVGCVDGVCWGWIGLLFVDVGVGGGWECVGGVVGLVEGVGLMVVVKWVFK